MSSVTDMAYMFQAAHAFDAHVDAIPCLGGCARRSDIILILAGLLAAPSSPSAWANFHASHVCKVKSTTTDRDRSCATHAPLQQ